MFMAAASCRVKSSITAEPTVPTTVKIPLAVLRHRRIWVRRPVALASLTSLERARGSPAVERDRRRA